MKVLIIDNDRTMRGVLRRILEIAGTSVLEAGELSEATHVIQTEVLDIVIADLNFLETAEENILEHWNTLGKFKFVGMYAPGDEDIVLALKKKNFRYFLRKPFKVPEVASVLSQITGRVIDLEKKILPVEPKPEIKLEKKSSQEKKPVAKRKPKIYFLIVLFFGIAGMTGYYLANMGVVPGPLARYFVRVRTIVNNDPMGLVVKNKDIFILDMLSQRIYEYDRKTFSLRKSYLLPHSPVTCFWMDENYVYVFNDWESRIRQYQFSGDNLVLVSSYQFNGKNVVAFCVFKNDFAAITFDGNLYLLNRYGRVISRKKLPYKNILGLTTIGNDWLILAGNRIYRLKENFLVSRTYELPNEWFNGFPVSSFFAYQNKLYFTPQQKPQLFELPFAALKKISG